MGGQGTGMELHDRGQALLCGLRFGDRWWHGRRRARPFAVQWLLVGPGGRQQRPLAGQHQIEVSQEVLPAAVAVP